MSIWEPGGTNRDSTEAKEFEREYPWHPKIIKRWATDFKKASSKQKGASKNTIKNTIGKHTKHARDWNAHNH